MRMWVNGICLTSMNSGKKVTSTLVTVKTGRVMPTSVKILKLMHWVHHLVSLKFTAVRLRVLVMSTVKATLCGSRKQNVHTVVLNQLNSLYGCSLVTRINACIHKCVNQKNSAQRTQCKVVSPFT